MDDSAFGALAVKEGFLTAAQLEQALDARGMRPLEEILVTRGLLTRRQVETLLDIERVYAVEAEEAEEPQDEMRLNLGLDTLSTAQVGPYRLLEEIDRGSMGMVFKAVHADMDQPVALKVLRASELLAPELARRFQREARVARLLHHPNIVAVHEAGQADGLTFIAMEYIEGVTFRRILAERSLSLREQVAILEKVARAVDYAHGRGVIHRDLKPANFLIDAAREPHLADFGLARVLNDPETPDGVLGTPFYMAPEQVAGKVVSTDARSDVYSMGVILYEILSGRLPFTGATVQEVYQAVRAGHPPGIPDDLDAPKPLRAAALRAMARERRRRHPSALALADELRRWIERKSTDAR